MAQLAPPQVLSAPAAAEVLRELERIVISPAFQGSKRSRQFLEHVCHRALAGEGASIKERTLAVEVFGRAAESDLGEDTIVRVGAREVRKRLVQYYATEESKHSPLAIDLPPGSYVPEFRFRQADAVVIEAPVVPPVGEPVVTRTPEVSRRWLMIGGPLAGAAAALLGLAAWRGRQVATSGFERFWGPVFASEEPLLVAISHPIVYHASQRAHRMTDERLGPMAGPGQRVIDVPAKELDGSDLIPSINQYTGFGDMIVTTEVAAMLARRGQAVRVRWADSVPFADLRQGQTILVGAVTNRWTVEMAQRWRFQFRRTPDRRHAIVDTTGTSEWKATAKDDGSTGDDFILIGRMRDTAAGGLLFVAAGVKQFGTEAAGRVLTDAGQLNAILEKLPAGWENRNLQLVLQVKVIGNTPGQPFIVATHVW
jgi:hypothetical protein